jgi:hypothetical protein
MADHPSPVAGELNQARDLALLADPEQLELIRDQVPGRDAATAVQVAERRGRGRPFGIAQQAKPEVPRPAPRPGASSGPGARSSLFDAGRRPGRAARVHQARGRAARDPRRGRSPALHRREATDQRRRSPAIGRRNDHGRRAWCHRRAARRDRNRSERRPRRRDRLADGRARGSVAVSCGFTLARRLAGAWRVEAKPVADRPPRRTS